ncbi:hypothetical protein [Pedobacter sp. P26]|uniref:hypothetical protein n=1 Tax=Pedobacter sp. P26 TaxID=3423956 RepID=UPI003D66BAA4
MLKTEGQNWIRNLKTRWISFYLTGTLAIALGIALLLSVTGFYLLHLPAWIFAVIFTIVAAILLSSKPVWRTTDFDVSRFLNNRYPELEESADLLLQNETELSMLQQLQRNKIENIIPNLAQPKEPVKRLYFGLGILVVALIISFGITKIPQISKTDSITEETQKPVPAIKENIPAEISTFSATIIPPAYTRKAERKQKQFSIAAETGATVNWKIETNIGIKKLKLIFSDNEIAPLKSFKCRAYAMDL